MKVTDQKSQGVWHRSPKSLEQIKVWCMSSPYHHFVQRTYNKMQSGEKVHLEIMQKTCGHGYGQSLENSFLLVSIEPELREGGGNPYSFNMMYIQNIRKKSLFWVFFSDQYQYGNGINTITLFIFLPPSNSLFSSAHSFPLSASSFRFCSSTFSFLLFSPRLFILLQFFNFPFMSILFSSTIFSSFYIFFIYSSQFPSVLLLFRLPLLRFSPYSSSILLLLLFLIILLFPSAPSH